MYIIHWGLCGMLGRIVGPGKVAGEDLILNLHHPTFRRHYSCMALTFLHAYVLESKQLGKQMHLFFPAAISDSLLSNSTAVAPGKILEEEDLNHTREKLRKAALKLCFSRTLIMEAQVSVVQLPIADRGKKMHPGDRSHS